MLSDSYTLSPFDENSKNKGYTMSNQIGRQQDIFTITDRKDEEDCGCIPNELPLKAKRTASGCKSEEHHGGHIASNVIKSLDKKFVGLITKPKRGSNPSLPYKHFIT